MSPVRVGVSVDAVSVSRPGKRNRGTTMTTMTHAEQAAAAPPLSREAAEELADRICAHAARQARDSCELLILIGEFDAGQGWGWSQGFKSVAHWLAWTCSMTAATAREHIRVARALRRMPTVTAAFGAGELSYSKVREVTRVVDVVDEAQLCELAKYATASQLARMIASYRAAAGTRIRAESRRLFRLVARDGDPMMGITGRLPPEEAAIVTTAVQRARDLHGVPPSVAADLQRSADPDKHDPTPPYSDAEALLDVCRHYLATAATEDESGEDRTLVIIEVAAEQLDHAEVPAGVAAQEQTTAEEFTGVGVDGVPAGMSQSPPSRFRITGEADAPAGTPQPATTNAGDGPAGTRHAAGLTFRSANAGGVPAGTRNPAGITSRTADVPARKPPPAAGPTSPAAARVDVPAGTPQPADSTTTQSEARTELVAVPSQTRPCPSTGSGNEVGTSHLPVGDVPAGTDRRELHHESAARPRAQVCTVRGTGPIEPQTAQRLICTGSILGAIVDRHGDVLALGRSRRLVSPRQRRALLIRDQTCQFPGCTRDRRLQAHHRIPWSHGGATDLTNLILLCGFHHTTVHEGGITIARRPGTPYLGARTGQPGWQFLLPDGQPVAESGWRVMTADHLIRHLSTLPGPNAHDHNDPTTIRTIGGGEGFSLHNCVEALFSMTRDQDHEAA
ncbi:DUF222 domain-containing protein [Microlunatus sp. GCM10028923]|uniref:HNH endonuclease signature motif containing protein n=1 Tax=Microlunatus sp. GCM10028923 TaxID=3273400 RepID=UPI00360F40FA